MRFLFRGIVRETGNPVEGHVEAADTEAAYIVLGNNGIITESIREDPKPLNLTPGATSIPEFADALESALDSSSSQVAFDDLARRYTGKNVWVIDRNKIRQRVALVVDSALAASEANQEGATIARRRVANAISGLFSDSRNIATEQPAASVAEQVAGSKNENPVSNQVAANNEALDEQIVRLGGVVRQAEGLIAAMASALRSIGSAGGGGSTRRVVTTAPQRSDGEQNEVLLEIFKSNMDLRKTMADMKPSPGQAA